MLVRLRCLILRHQWATHHDEATRDTRRTCRRCGTEAFGLSEMDLNPNHFDPLGAGLGPFGR